MQLVGTHRWLLNALDGQVDVVGDASVAQIVLTVDAQTDILRCDDPVVMLDYNVGAEDAFLAVAGGSNVAVVVMIFHAELELETVLYVVHAAVRSGLHIDSPLEALAGADTCNHLFGSALDGHIEAAGKLVSDCADHIQVRLFHAQQRSLIQVRGSTDSLAGIAIVERVASVGSIQTLLLALFEVCHILIDGIDSLQDSVLDLPELAQLVGLINAVIFQVVDHRVGRNVHILRRPFGLLLLVVHLLLRPHRSGRVQNRPERAQPVAARNLLAEISVLVAVGASDAIHVTGPDSILKVETVGVVAVDVVGHEVVLVQSRSERRPCQRSSRASQVAWTVEVMQRRLDLLIASLGLTDRVSILLAECAFARLSIPVCGSALEVALRQTSLHAVFLRLELELASRQSLHLVASHSLERPGALALAPLSGLQRLA